MRGQMYTSSAMGQRITSTLIVGALLGCASAFGTTVLTPVTNLRDQVASADYVVRGRILEVQTIDVRAENSKTRHCGTVLTVRADEQFRGRLPSTVKFSSVPMIRVARLEVGQNLLLLLNDAEIHRNPDTAPDRGFLVPDDCKKLLPSIYVAVNRENVFELRRADSTDTKEWLLFGEFTEMPEDVAGVIPRRCHPNSLECSVNDPARVPWTSIREWISTAGLGNVVSARPAPE